MGGAKKLYINQKHVSFQNVPRNKNNLYNTYNRPALQAAMSILSHSALKLYLYFGNYKDMPNGIYLSKQDALHSTGLSEKSYFSAFKELKEKGYMVKDQNKDTDDHYIFYESPGGT
jgi:hypothetical protein